MHSVPSSAPPANDPAAGTAEAAQWTAALTALNGPLTSLAGMGPKLGPLYAKLVGGERVVDLLFHLPAQYLLRQRCESLAAAEDGTLAIVAGEVDALILPKAPTAPRKIRLRDDSGFLFLVFFRADHGFLERSFPIRAKRVAAGLVQSFNGERQIAHPDWVVDPDKEAEPPLCEPVYPMAAGVFPRALQRFMGRAFTTLPEPDFPEWADPPLVRREGWPAFARALALLHARDGAPDEASREAARKRLAYDELFARQLALRLLRQERRVMAGPVIPQANAATDTILAALPYAPTAAQTRAHAEIRRDLATGEPMMRLLQGDVGSGKTLVAALAAADLAAAGFQTAIMAPTEILARQQAHSIGTTLAAAGFRTACLTGRDKGKARAALLARIRSGETEIVVGTHALFQDDIEFRRLGLVIVDEQHRFGVLDRGRLVAKSEAAAHLLVMSATPIPRSLALAAHGDMDISVLDEKPPGRRKVETRVLPLSRLAETIESLGRAMAQGGQIYWICPLVEEKTQDAAGAPALSAAESRCDGLRVRFPGVVGLLHGRLAAAEKEAALEGFKSGRIRILVSTTVVEVGVDAPDATLIVIEHAERFGLAQLHQLRGRVGRSDKNGTCLLLYQSPLSMTGRERLGVIRATDDGFAIAEADYRLRGAGDIMGEAQSGSPGFRFVNLVRDGDLVAFAHQDASLLLANDPALQSARGRAARLALALFAGRKAETALLTAG